MTNNGLKYCVYCHTNKINNKSYIGITGRNANLRWGKDGKGYKDCPHFWRAIQKYGWDNFEHIILFEHLTKDEACRREILLIALFNTQNPKAGYNISFGGNLGLTGCRLSDETRKNMSNAKLGELNPMYGKHIVWSDETIEKLRKSKLGELNPMYGKSGVESPVSISICQCDMDWNIINIFGSVHEAERVTGVKSGNISSVCTQNPTNNGYVRHTAGGYRSRYAIEEEIENAKNISF